MNYLLVAFTFLMLTASMAGLAMLGTDRLFPGRKAIGYFSQDGIELEPGQQPPLLISSTLDSESLTKLSFSTALLGYNKDEVDQLLTRLIQENERLRQQEKV
ncbi:MAG: DivIVA domain-containing protein [Rothia sp. (in: high G+C Gram-positive bacteria)]|nr:DivIVA domain-containing protein [Rothia sp. (in: high G+C Gram-positive bacteria)]